MLKKTNVIIYSLIISDQKYLSAFSAKDISLITETVTKGNNDRLVFLHTTLNEGGHYNIQTGEYVCPVDGLYFFTLTVRSGSVSEELGKYGGDAGIFHNGQNQKDIHFVNHNEGKISAVLSGSAVIHCRRNDKVWVACTRTGSRFYNHVQFPANVFTGCLIVHK